jgi:uncharacterized oxidoreductase
MPVLTHQQLRTLLEQHLVRVNTPQDIARQVADNLVDASLKGHDSHGVTLLPRYISAILAGDLQPSAQLRLIRDAGPLLSFHGGYGFGQVLGRQAMAAGIERAQQYGVALVSLADSHHLGRIGAWAEQVAAEGWCRSILLMSPRRLRYYRLRDATRALAPIPSAWACRSAGERR